MFRGLSSHQNEFNISHWHRQNIQCDSTQGAPSLVPTSSEVCIPNSGSCRRIAMIGILKRRIEAALDGMDVLLRRKPKEPDGEEELERRRTRSVEFLSRFSRNYLFQLRMQMMELKRQMQYCSANSPGRYTHHQLMLKKLLAAHQTVVQGLQACLNQLPGSVHDPAILTKLDKLLCYLCELTTLRREIDVNECHGSKSPLPQDNIETKAQNLIEIVRRKRKGREEADEAWRGAATLLAKKRFGLPPSSKTKTASRPTPVQEKKLWSMPDRRRKKQRLGKNVELVKTKRNFQGGDCELPLHPLNDVDQPEHRIDKEADGSLDPATALELKTIMSRMKAILRGAHHKQPPQPEPTYPSNVRLVYITHEEQPSNANADESDGPTEEKQTEKENRTSDHINQEDELPSKVNSQSQSQLVSDFAKQIEKRSPVSSIRLGRKLTPEEQRILKYRNRFRSYKERIREIQRTSEELLSTVFKEVANELEPSILLDKMYHLELQG